MKVRAAASLDARAVVAAPDATGGTLTSTAGTAVDTVGETTA
jgi:hypothetical protein